MFFVWGFWGYWGYSDLVFCGVSPEITEVSLGNVEWELGNEEVDLGNREVNREMKKLVLEP